MKSEFTAIIDTAPEGGYWAICPEIPGANGQGETITEAKESLRQAISSSWKIVEKTSYAVCRKT